MGLEKPSWKPTSTDIPLPSTGSRGQEQLRRDAGQSGKRPFPDGPWPPQTRGPVSKEALHTPWLLFTSALTWSGLTSDVGCVTSPPFTLNTCFTNYWQEEKCVNQATNTNPTGRVWRAGSPGRPVR